MNYNHTDWKPTHEEQTQIRKEKRFGDFIAVMVLMILFAVMMKMGWAVVMVLGAWL